MDDAKPGLLARARSRRAKVKEAGIGKNQRAAFPEMSYKNIPRPATSGEYNSLRSDEIIIGLALGSPRESPLRPVAHDDRDDLATSPFPLSEEKASEADSDDKAPKRKVTKWKSFGGLFSKKDNQSKLSPHPPSSPFQAAHHAETNDTSPQRAKSLLNRAGSDIEESAQRTSTSRDTHYEVNPFVLRRSSTKRKLLRKRKIEELKHERQRANTFPPSGVSGSRPHPPLDDRLQIEKEDILPLARPSLLTVNIPNVEMERYSVMFGDVLSSRPQTSAQMSLLARRQANLDDLVPKPLSIRKDRSPAQQASKLADAPKAEEDAKPVLRDHSASSSVSKSPSFSLFPTITAATGRGPTSKSIPKPSPLSRSLTAPSDTASVPSRPILKANKTEDMDELVTLVDSCHDLRPSKNPMTEIRKESVTHFYSEHPSHPNLIECPELRSEHEASTTDNPSQDVFLQRTFPARKSSMKDSFASQSPKPPLDRLHKSNDSITSLSAAEVSIARQISFSHRQRQLLVPIMSKNARQPQLVDTSHIVAMRNSHHLHLEQV